jgi:hypothetical protein
MLRGSAKAEDHEWVVTTFCKRRAAIENASAASKLVFQLTLATFWKSFIAQHGSSHRFAQLPRSAQMEYFKSLLRLQAKLFEQEDFAKVIPLEMLNLYVAAIISKSPNFEIEVATFLDRHLRQGTRMLPSAIGLEKGRIPMSKRYH